MARHGGDHGEPPWWSATDPPRDDALDNLQLRGPHDLRHTFSTWLENAGIPAPSDRRTHGPRRRPPVRATGQRDWPRSRHTAPEMEARVTVAIEQRLAVSLAVAARASRQNESLLVSDGSMTAVRPSR